MESGRFSAQTSSVLLALGSSATQWRHGYDLAKQTGLKSGTLYPILIRLADRGLVAARWEDEQPAGRPRRHLYQLTASGLTAADAVRAALRAKAQSSKGRAASRLGLAGEGA